MKARCLFAIASMAYQIAGCASALNSMSDRTPAPEALAAKSRELTAAEKSLIGSKVAASFKDPGAAQFQWLPIILFKRQDGVTDYCAFVNGRIATEAIRASRRYTCKSYWISLALSFLLNLAFSPNQPQMNMDWPILQFGLQAIWISVLAGRRHEAAGERRDQPADAGWIVLAGLRLWLFRLDLLDRLQNIVRRRMFAPIVEQDRHINERHFVDLLVSPPGPPSGARR